MSGSVSRWKKKVYSDLEVKGVYTAPCYLCGKNLTKDNATVDHYMPKSKGGSGKKENLRIACKNCNVKKDSKLPRSKPKRNWNGKAALY